MTQTTVIRRGMPLALTALTTISAAAAWSPSPTFAASTQAKAKVFKGAAEYVDHGPVQVSIAVKNKKITSVSVANSPEDGRSVFIQSRAIPLLKSETLRAQSANISLVSGATDTSEGYVASLQNAITKARSARALK